MQVADQLVLDQLGVPFRVVWCRVCGREELKRSVAVGGEQLGLF